ncbi:MAG: hypothetical protein LQ340_002930 [Diploschistes diacapsis]|nr:MAG: hypothetical protein LQ340_002930 [Diploschistes diacapsis]
MDSPKPSVGRLSQNTSHSTSGNASDDYSRFREVMDAINAGAIPQIVSDVRGEGLSCAMDEYMCAGSYNLIISLTFTDGIKWAVRIPQHGTREHFGEEEAQAMRREMELLRAIRLKTTIPIPEVYHFDTSFENELGAPFSVVQWLEGEPVTDLWWDSNGPTTLADRRLRILGSLAKNMAQLAFLNSSKIGVPEIEFQKDSEVAVIRQEAIRIRDDYNEFDMMTQGIKAILFYESGPFDTTAAFYHSILDHVNPQPPAAWARGSRMMLRLMVEAIGSHQSDSEKRFVLSHPDLDVQNILIAEDGTVTAILDWDGSRIGPEELGYSKYPAFLRNDWNPDHYPFWSKDPERRMFENSPRELREFRKFYHDQMTSRIGSASLKTVNSHVFESLEIACKNPVAGFKIICKLFRVCFKKCPFPVIHLPNGQFELLEASSSCNASASGSSEADSENGSVFSKTGEHDTEIPDDGYDTRETSPGHEWPPQDALPTDAQADACSLEGFTKAKSVVESNSAGTVTSNKPGNIGPDALRPSIAAAIKTFIILLMILGWLLTVLFASSLALLSISYRVGKAVFIEDTAVDFTQHLGSIGQYYGQALIAPFTWLRSARRDYEIKQHGEQLHHTTSIPPLYTQPHISDTEKPEPASPNNETQDLDTEQNGDSDDEEVGPTHDDECESYEEKSDVGSDGGDEDDKSEDGEDDEADDEEDDEEDDSDDDDSDDAFKELMADPNRHTEGWFYHLFNALAEDKLSSSQKDVLRNRFAEVFFSTEIVEEEGLE